MNPLKKYILFFLLGINGLFMGCSGINPEDFDRKTLLVNLGENIILPKLQAFHASCKSLDSVATLYASDPTEPRFSELQDLWLETALYIKWVELFRQGPVDQLFLFDKIDKWPLNISALETIISTGGTWNNAFIENKPSNTKGIVAIEYLIFDPVSGNQAILAQLNDINTGANRREYLSLLTHHLWVKSGEILYAWDPLGDDYLHIFFSYTQMEISGSVNLLANQMIALTETMHGMKLGRPMGKEVNGTLNIENCEAFRSRQSLRLLQENLTALEAIFTGKEGIGFEDYLDAVDVQTEGGLLSAKILQQIQSCRNAFTAIGTSLEQGITSNPTATEQAHQELKKLLVLFKSDMASALSITVTFSSNDGD